MNIADFRNRQNLAICVSAVALVVSLASLGHSSAPKVSAKEDNDTWKSERQYPPLVFTSNSWLDCSISSSANGRQVMTTTSGQG
ncbi:MAG TPA: hypothetical protein VEX69_02960, partial [Candidatus Limnocylindria bacterium]|nr:hypothetical protein [Candidatus Limnocylindria bacterium]